MEEKLERILYWTGTIIAGSIVMAVVVSYVSNAGKNFPVISTAALLLAGTVWLVGWACSHMYAGR